MPQKTRHADLRFSDEEVITLYLYGVIEGHRTIEAIHRYAQKHLTSWFPHLSGYKAFDLAMGEDQCRVYNQWAAENFSALRKIALFYLEKDTSLKAGIQIKQFNAALDEEYLTGLLALSSPF